MALFTTLVWVGVVLAVVSAVFGGLSLRTGDTSAAWLLPLAALLLFCDLAVAQLLGGSLPIGASPGAAAPHTISSIRTGGYLLAALTYTGAWLLVMCTVRTRQRAQQLLGGLLAAGVLQAIGAVLLYPQTPATTCGSRTSTRVGGPWARIPIPTIWPATWS